MKRVFVSHYPGSSAHGPALVAALRASGCVVAQSPDPDRMENWYASGLSDALDKSNVFVCVVCASWDSSTWMAIEADEALKRFNSNRIGKYFTYNPEKLPVRAEGMIPYLLNPLPHKLSEAVGTILGQAT